MSIVEYRTCAISAERKGRGRSNRPKLPSTWMPLLPASSPLSPDAPPSCASSREDDYHLDGGTPIPFNLLDAESGRASRESGGDGPTIGTSLRRGFECSASFQDFGGLHEDDPRRLVPMAMGPPLIGGKLRHSGADPRSMLLPEVSMLTSCMEEESAPHRRTPRQSHEQDSSGSCFNV